jgi:CDP-diacylglycerol--serine O-phosphatidyltransferase
MKLFSVPNLITLGNLFCGCLAIVFAFQGDLIWSAYLVGIAAVLDFLDGFAARALKQYSPIGKDLDSLADMVTFGVVPGIVMFKLMILSWQSHDPVSYLVKPQVDLLYYKEAFLAFLITLFSALRLAKFNNDTRQSDSFIGVPTPANSILICSLPLVLQETGLMNGQFIGSLAILRSGYTGFIMHPATLIVVTVVMSFLLIAEIPLFSLKIKSFGWKGNELRYSFLALSLVMLVFLKFIALPLIIVLYILLSVFNNLVKRKS